MKQKDLAVVIGAGVVSAIFAFLITGKFIFTAKDRQQKVEVVTPITSEFNLPSKAVFNTDAINPTQLIQIGPNSNNQPFANH